MRSIKRVILGLGAFEKVKRYEAGNFFEMTVARHSDVLERGFGPLGNSKTVHRDEHVGLLKVAGFTIGADRQRRRANV
jgi:hypothetical protein